MSAEQPTPKQNGAIQVLSTLASSGDTWVKLGTLALVAFSGMGNWLATQTGNKGIEENTVLLRQQRAQVVSDLDRVKTEVHQMYQSYEDVIERQKQTARFVHDSFEAQNRLLDNQTKILNTQTEMLKVQHQVLFALRPPNTMPPP